ncbi:MAG TPA: FAD-dependent oxidoreductase, partial [Janthinobacterium sp.]|nr:FAD-dependent oxidoreductase [Janthinobacterium sp.]
MAALNIGIAGAGLLGRLLAWQLSGLGHRVTLFDPAAGPLQRGQAAGWSAAGMLCPWAELECGGEAVAALGLRSLQLWPALLAQLPQRVYFRRAGSLLLAQHEDLVLAQRSVAPLQGHARALAPEELRKLEPAVNG